MIAKFSSDTNFMTAVSLLEEERVECEPNCYSLEIEIDDDEYQRWKNEIDDIVHDLSGYFD